ncbi:SMI1/KNR4 family protein [Streptomyces sp. NPDC001780]
MSGSEEADGDEERRALNTPREWRDFLDEYGALYREGVDDNDIREFDEEQLEEGGWLGSEPATEEAVAAAEQRLGLRFPPSYRSFLLTTNGWTALRDWIDEVHPCEEVTWMRDTGLGSGLVDLYADEFPDADLVALFRRSLQVASGEDLWLLDPTDVGPDGEWAAHLFQPKYGELESHTGFAGLFHESKDSLE